jgi:uracil-DNA glycosylase
MDGILNSWLDFLTQLNLRETVETLLDQVYREENVLPPRAEVLSLFKLINPQDVRVVIIGQDPYHTPGVANGIAFATKNSKTPPSLKNIFKELQNDLGIVRTDNDLSDWVRQGVLLINSVFTVRAGEPNSHQHVGWQAIVQKILSGLNEMNSEIIYCLWGNNAKYLYNNLEVRNKNCIISAHPSPFSYARGFAGSTPFSKINKMLRMIGGQEIKW